MARGFNYADGASRDIDLARSADLERDQILALGQGKNALVREIVAAREDCPLGLMVTLAHDHVTDVRVAIARNPRALQSVMEYLAKDKQPAVILALLTNPSLPEEVVKDLAFNHKRREVREAASGLIEARATGYTARASARPEVAVALEDAATPELRDRPAPSRDDVFDRRQRTGPGSGDANVVDIATGQPLQFVSEPPPSLVTAAPPSAPSSPQRPHTFEAM
jgi:hypothetical protein